ncbi:type II toxin-antitoxin system PemK/MazF family toxin [Nonomuraea typhae]|uniref:Type II toxin-antitoxin system PemK/MazF family toxin n=1 Tax=Nonomuraea typhae TaxID=2603600 RepID=A0ABW7Z8E4_9ACTN
MNAGDLWTVKHPVYGSEQVLILSGEIYNRQARIVFAAPVRAVVDSAGYNVPLGSGGFVAIDTMRMLGRDDLIEQTGRASETDIMQVKIVLSVIFDLGDD